MLKRLWSKLRTFYRLFIAPTKLYVRPRESDILIHDACNTDLLEPYLSPYSAEILPLRGESINLPCFIRSLLDPNFWKGNPLRAYTDAFIRTVNPSLIITFIDNTSSFYTLSCRFPGIKTMFLQNGTRGEICDIFGFLRPNPQYHVDYMLVHGAAVGRQYQKFISGEIVVAGSLNNNSRVKQTRYEKGTVLFLSQYSEQPENDQPLWTDPDGTPCYWEQYYWAERPVLEFLRNYCEEHRLRLMICGRLAAGEGGEREFYTAHLDGSDWQYCPRLNSYSSYDLVDLAEIVVFIDSTLGYEAIGRGKKTAGFAIRGASMHNDATKFGWPAGLPDNGPFWTNDANEREFRRVLDYLTSVSDQEWENTRQHYGADLMEFDPGNSRFVDLLQQLLPKPKMGANVQG